MNPARTEPSASVSELCSDINCVIMGRMQGRDGTGPWGQYGHHSWISSLAPVDWEEDRVV